MSLRCASTMSTPTALSAYPTDQAKPEDVDASALKPSPCSQRAEPTSHGLGITKQPDLCSSRNAWRLSVTDGRAMAVSPLNRQCRAPLRGATMHFSDGTDQRRYLRAFLHSRCS